MPDTDNGKVTLAVLGNKVDNLRDDVQEWRAEARKCHDDHESRVRELETKATKNTEQHKALRRDNRIFSSVESVAAAMIGAAAGLFGKQGGA